MQSKARNASPKPDDIKRAMRVQAVSYRVLAPKLGVTYQHLCLVLNGHRISARLLRAAQKELAA